MISIVVITMNNPDELYSTLGSISNILSYPSCLPIIVHIIDSSHTPTDLPKYAFPVDYLHTKPQGIYHAMNLGLLQSFEFSSEFVWFLNSGCMAFDPLESSALFNTLGSKYDIFFFSYRTSLPRASIVKPHNFLPLIPRQPTNHQSIIYKTDFLKQNNLLYQASLSISADDRWSIAASTASAICIKAILQNRSFATSVGVWPLLFRIILSPPNEISKRRALLLPEAAA